MRYRVKTADFLNQPNNTAIVFGETVIVLHERSVDAVASKLTPDELLHVIRLVGRCPSCYPPGTLDALKHRLQTPAPQSPSVSASTDLMSRGRQARIYGRTHALRFERRQSPATPAMPFPGFPQFLHQPVLLVLSKAARDLPHHA